MIKIKFDIGGGEILNCWVAITKIGDHYALIFNNGSFDKFCKFDLSLRCFYGA